MPPATFVISSWHGDNHLSELAMDHYTFPLPKRLCKTGYGRFISEAYHVLTIEP